MKRLAMLFLLGSGLFAQTYNNTNGGTYSRNWWDHKVGHFGICFGFSWGGAKLNQPKLGFGIAMGMGLAKELYDVKHGESQMNLRRDLLIDLAGAYTGYWLGSRHKHRSHKPVDPILAFEFKTRLEMKDERLP